MGSLLWGLRRELPCWVCVVGLSLVRGQEPNPPVWPASVTVYSPSSTIISKKRTTQFSRERQAYLFQPGEYDGVDVAVSYYTSVYGLGRTPDETAFVGGGKQVHCEEESYEYNVGALNTFWRSAENFATDADFEWWPGARGMLWATSQGSPLRRLHVKGDLFLYQYVPGDSQAGYASGGFLADSVVDGKVSFGSQQQYFTASSTLRQGWDAGQWNLVFYDATPRPDESCDADAAVVVVDDTPVSTGETPRPAFTKPYIIFDDGKYYLKVSSSEEVDFADVKVVANSTDLSTTTTSKYLVLSPGIYETTVLVVVDDDGSVLLGLGLATIRGTLDVRAADATIAGVLIEAAAGQQEGGALVSWSGPRGLFADGFLRLGRFSSKEEEVSTATMLAVESAGFVGDDVWIWRADHDAQGQVANKESPCETGLLVTAAEVSFFGLFVEHCLQTQVDWRGDRGFVAFFQSEFAYDSTADFDEPSYLVADDVSSHRAYGVGAYAYFRDAEVNVSAAIRAPKAAFFTAPFSVYLDGQGAISHVLNTRGRAVGPYYDSRVHHLCGDDLVDVVGNPPKNNTTNSRKKKKNKKSNDDDDEGPPRGPHLRDLAIALGVVAASGFLTAICLMRRHAGLMANDDWYRPPPPAPGSVLDGNYEMSNALLDAEHQRQRHDRPASPPFVYSRFGFGDFDYDIH